MVDQPKFRFPERTHRLAIMGRTGSGKSVFGAHVLSQSAFDKFPHIIVDYKYDDLLTRIPFVPEIGAHEKPPKHPGLYIMHPKPTDAEDVENFLWKIWDKEETGLFFDEAYMLPNSGQNQKGAYVSLLTQGRAKRIPIITLTQRPTQMTLFHFTEADFFSVFRLQWKRDRAKVMEYVPTDLERRLPDYYSWYHDVSREQTFGLFPSPDPDTIVTRFEHRLAPKRRFV